MSGAPAAPPHALCSLTWEQWDCPIMLSCCAQVDECGVDLSTDEFKKYNRRNRVCCSHQKAMTVLIKGQASRYCQQVRPRVQHVLWLRCGL